MVVTTLMVLLLAGGMSGSVANVAMAEPVRVDYYMEALCPFCAKFTLEQLQPLFVNKLINHVQLDVIPYGNAHTDPNTGAVSCQHGAVECDLNKVLSCAIALNPRQDDWFPFFACIEDAASKGVQPDQVEGVTHGCAVHAGLVSSKLMDCYKGQLGDVLQRLAQQRTSSLKPAHQYVPWVVVNGIPLLDDSNNIMRYICVAYRGRDRPKVCLDIPEPSTGGSPGTAAPLQQRQQQQGQGQVTGNQQEQPQHCRRGQRPGTISLS